MNVLNAGNAMIFAYSVSESLNYHSLKIAKADISEDFLIQQHPKDNDCILINSKLLIRKKQDRIIKLHTFASLIIQQWLKYNNYFSLEDRGQRFKSFFINALASEFVRNIENEVYIPSDYQWLSTFYIDKMNEFKMIFSSNKVEFFDPDGFNWDL